MFVYPTLALIQLHIVFTAVCRLCPYLFVSTGETIRVAELRSWAVLYPEVIWVQIHIPSCKLAGGVLAVQHRYQGLVVGDEGKLHAIQVAVELPDCPHDACLHSSGRLPSCFVPTEFPRNEVYWSLHLLDNHQCVFLHFHTVRLAEDGCHVPGLPIAGHSVSLGVVRVGPRWLRSESSLQPVECLGMLRLPLRV